MEDKEALFCFGAIEANKLMIMHMDESLIENMISLRVSVYIARPYLERTTQDWLMHLSFKKNKNWLMHLSLFIFFTFP